MKFNIHHATLYSYSQPLLYSVQTLHMWPSSGPCQTVEQWDVRSPSILYAQPDGQGNWVHSFSLVARCEEDLLALKVVARGQVITHGVALFTDTGRLHPAFFLRPTPLAEPHPRMAVWALQNVPALAAVQAHGGQPTVDDLLVLVRAVASKVQYRQGSTDEETTALEAFDWELGVSQDQAHVMVAVCRSIGLPARYVSGYFYAANEPELASHAWVDVCLDPASRRWISLDVTHRCLTDERHIRLAAAADCTACLPIKGLRRGGGDERMNVDIRIEAAT